jgi:hypothetical protein
MKFTSSLLVLVCINFADAQEGKVRLFILSGQSNMAGLRPETSFTPAIKAAFPKDENIFVKSAQGGAPIRQWVKNWKAPEHAKVKSNPGVQGKLYGDMMSAVKKAVGDKKVDSVVFVWMQGERDAREYLHTVYEESLRALLGQLQTDLGRKDIAVVIGRLSDCAKNQGWTAIRVAQVSFAEKTPMAAWVDTDDLNGETNALHYTPEGYNELGKRFAAKAVELINKAGR